MLISLRYYGMLSGIGSAKDFYLFLSLDLLWFWKPYILPNTEYYIFLKRNALIISFIIRASIDDSFIYRVARVTLKNKGLSTLQSTFYPRGVSFARPCAQQNLFNNFKNHPNIFQGYRSLWKGDHACIVYKKQLLWNFFQQLQKEPSVTKFLVQKCIQTRNTASSDMEDTVEKFPQPK